jgi:hypothetical protein
MAEKENMRSNFNSHSRSGVALPPLKEANKFSSWAVQNLHEVPISDQPKIEEDGDSKPKSNCLSLSGSLDLDMEGSMDSLDDIDRIISRYQHKIGGGAPSGGPSPSHKASKKASSPKKVFTMNHKNSPLKQGKMAEMKKREYITKLEKLDGSWGK